MTGSIASYYASKILALAAIAAVLAVTFGIAGCGTLKLHDTMQIWQNIADHDGGAE